MERLTRKIQQCEIDMYNPTRPEDDKYVESDYMCKRDAYDRDVVNKLGQLEDIEDELGIDFFIIFKALKDGCYALYAVDKESAFIEPGQVHIMKDRLRVGFWPEEWANDKLMSGHECVWGCLYKDYGRTWALTKEELE